MIKLEKLSDSSNLPLLATFNSGQFSLDIVMFDKLRKKIEEESNQGENSGGEMVKERPNENQQSLEEKRPETVIESSYHTDAESENTSEIGIGSLMNKRAKLEEAIDYVGLMIKNLKDKRTNLEKEIEDESVDIKNLKEKLVKVTDYINEENVGIQNLVKKRSEVEKEADDVGTIINDLRDKLSSIGSIVDEEGKRIKSFKDTRPKTDEF